MCVGVVFVGAYGAHKLKAPLGLGDGGLFFKVFTKLGIRSRSQLERAIGGGADRPSA